MKFGNRLQAGREGLAACLLVAALGLAAQAQAQPSRELLGKIAGPTDAQELHAMAQRKGHVRVIASFEAPVAAPVLLHEAAAFATASAHVAMARNGIVVTHFGDAGAPRPGAGFSRGLVGFPITPAFAVNVTARELEALAADPRVRNIQHDRPEPPLLAQSVPLIGMTAAYNANATGTGRTVVVLDTGILANHEMVAGKVVAEACFSNAGGGAGAVSLCPNGQPSQTGSGASDANAAPCNNGGAGNLRNLCNHGMHVAGIAAGLNTNVANGGPANGVAKSSKIFNIQVFTRIEDTERCNGADFCVLTFSSDQILALNHILANLNPGGSPVAAVNMSLGGGQFSGTCDNDARKSAIDALRANGVLTIVAAGNSSLTSQIGAPACISSALAVGSTDKNDVISTFSNMSPVVKVMAPGTAINSAVALNALSLNSFGAISGTSMAAPHVAGAVAAIKSACPLATPTQIEAALVNTGLPIADTRDGGTLTKPRIRIDQALPIVCAARVAHEFNGDFKSDILWRGPSGEVALWLMNGATLSGGPLVGGAPTNWTILASADFNGDGKADILWRGPNGEIALWLLNGANIISGPLVGGVPGGWSIVGVGDFNGDGKSDILWRGPSGEVALWLMDGAALIGGPVVGSAPLSWTIAGVGDFNGDGKSDLLWRGPSGEVAVWLLNGGTLISGPLVSTVPLSFAIAGTGDFDGDGKSDILWRGPNGEVIVWLMDGGTLLNGTQVAAVPASWTVVGTADFDGNGKSDILWRGPNGEVIVWLMDGGTLLNGTQVAAVPASWTVVGTADFDGNGKSDILWREASGLVAAWFMNGVTLANGPVLGSAPATWTIQGMR